MGASYIPWAKQKVENMTDNMQAIVYFQIPPHPELMNQGEALGDYASRAVKDFQHLQNEIAGLDKNDTAVPDPIRETVKEVVGRLKQTTIPLSDAVKNLSSQITEFHYANKQFDADIDALKQRGVTQEWWEVVWGSTAVLEEAAGLVLGEWRAITSDLEDVMSGKIDITMPFLMGLDIDVALAEWRQIRREAKAFGSLVDGLQKYLTGQWLKEGQCIKAE